MNTETTEDRILTLVIRHVASAEQLGLLLASGGLYLTEIAREAIGETGDGVRSLVSFAVPAGTDPAQLLLVAAQGEATQSVVVEGLWFGETAVAADSAGLPDVPLDETLTLGQSLVLPLASAPVAPPPGAFVGTAGADTMVGGAGDDTYYVDNAGDRVVEAYGAATNGFDTVVSTVDYALDDSTWVETLQAGSDAGLALTGNGGFNTLVGGGGDDRLDGGAGRDELFGGAGDDVLVAGLGSDTLDGGAGLDTALYAGKAADYSVRHLDDGRTLVSGTNTYDYLANIERLQFADLVIEVPGRAGSALLATDDSAATREDEATVLDLLGNDAGEALTVTGFQATTAQGGSVTLNPDGSFGYRPAVDFHGTDSFTYRVVDRNGATGTATATLVVAPVNDAPEAVADSFTVAHGESFAGQGLLDNDRDVEGDALSVIAFDAVSAKGGTVVVAADGGFSYRPADGFAGEDSFTYTVGDGQGGTATQTVSLSVAPPSGAILGTAGADRLVGTAAADLLVGGAGADTMIGGMGDDTYYVDNAGDRVVEAYGAATNGFDTVVSTVDYALDDSTWVETLQAGSDSGLALTGNGGFNTLIGGGGDDRLDGGAGRDELFGGAGDDILIAGLGSDTLDGGAGLDTALYAGKVADYSVRHLDDGRTVVSGAGTYDYLANIERLQFADRLVEIPGAAADGPAAAPDTAETEEDRTVTLDLLGNDTGDGLTVAAFDGTSEHGGSVTRNEDGSFTYRPAADFSGTDSFSYQVTDRHGASSSATATVVVAPLNDAPDAAPDGVEAVEDTSVRIEVLANDSDADGDALTIAGHDGTSLHGGTIMVNEDGSLTYRPAADFNGVDSFEYQVRDSAGAVSSATVTVVVASVNDVPDARDDVVEVEEDSSVRIDLLANDQDVDGDALKVSWHQAITEKGGSVVLQADGSVIYTPAPDFHGTDSFAYRIVDASGAVGAAVAMILVAGVNDLPEAYADSFDVPYGEAFATNGVLDNDRDVDGDSLGVVAFDAVSLRGGSVEVAADGSFSYLPAAGFFGDDSFTYKVGDGQGGTATQTVSLKVALPANAIVGTAGADRLQGTAAADVIVGGAGADTMIGGAGDDTYYVDNAADRIVEAYGAAANGFDTVVTTVDYALGDNVWVETLQAGSDAGLALTGNSGFNTLIGGGGNDRLDGGAGKDQLYGGDGDDVLIAGLGSDTLDGGAGTDTALYAGKAADYGVSYQADGGVVVKGTDTYDFLSNIERLQFADGIVEVPASDASRGPTEADAEAPSSPSTGSGGVSAPSGPTSGVVTGPEIVKPQAPGEVVGLQLSNDSGQAAAAQTVTIGQAFRAGALQPGEGLVARIGGSEVAVQVDVKALNDDGSVRHAVLSFETPAMAAGQTLDVMLAEAPVAGGAALDPLAVLQAQGHDFKLEVTLQGSAQPVTLDLEDLLAQARAEGRVETWLSGPQVSEVRVSAAINETLEARFDIRVHEDGTVRTSVTVANEWGYKEGVGTETYDARVLVDGEEAFAAEGLEHYSWSTWREVFTRQGEGTVAQGEPGGVRVLRDIEYLIEAGAIPRIDTSTGIDAAALERAGSLLQERDFGPLGSGAIYTFMPGTGDRPDIGVISNWAADYLSTQDARAYELLMANGEAAGSIPWHFRDSATGEYVSVDDHPKLWLDYRGTDSRYGDDAPPVVFSGKGGGFTLDTAHEPDVSYLPYLLSGDRYYLDNLLAQASYDMAALDPRYREVDAEMTSASHQVRGQAWLMRTLTNTAWITPEGEALKTYFEDKLQSNLEAYVQQYLHEGVMDDAGELEGYIRGTDGPGRISAWQNNYFATVMDLISSRGHEEAGELLTWQANFLTGLWLSGDKGYDPIYGAPYKLYAYDPTTGNVLTGDRVQTWAELFEQSFTAEGYSGTDVVPDPQYGAAWAGGHGGNGYAALSRAGLAGLITLGIPEASEAFGWVVEHTQSVDPTYTQSSKFAIMPEFADGSTLRIADMHVGAAGSDTFLGTAANELYAGSAGNDRIEGGGGIDLLYGGDGNDVMRGGVGDDQLFGGEGADVIEGGLGNDLIKGGKGADRFEFRAGNSGADTILDFDLAEDRIGVQGGYRLSEDGQGQAIVVFDDGSSATLLGIDPDELQDHHFYGL